MKITDALRVRFAFSKVDRKLSHWCAAAAKASYNSQMFFSDADAWFGPEAESRPNSPIRRLAFEKELLFCSGYDEAVTAYAKYERAENEARAQIVIREYQESDDSQLARDYQNAATKLAEIDDGKHDDLGSRDIIARERTYYQTLLSCSTDDEVIAAYRAFREASIEWSLRDSTDELMNDPSESWIGKQYLDAGKETQWLEQSKSSIEEMIDHIKSGDAFIYKNCLVDPKGYGFYQYGEKKLVFETGKNVDKLYATQDAREALRKKVNDIAQDDNLYRYIVDLDETLLEVEFTRVPDAQDIERIKVFEEFILPQFDKS